MILHKIIYTFYILHNELFSRVKEHGKNSTHIARPYWVDQKKKSARRHYANKP